MVQLQIALCPRIWIHTCILKKSGILEHSCNLSTWAIVTRGSLGTCWPVNPDKLLSSRFSAKPCLLGAMWLSFGSEY